MEAAPNAATLGHYRRCGLVASKDTDGSDLQFAMTMTTKAIDKKLRLLFPDVFAYLDEHHLRVGGQLHWVLAVKSGTSMAISSASEPSGEDVMMTRNPKGRKWGAQNVYFGTY